MVVDYESDPVPTFLLESRSQLEQYSDLCTFSQLLLYIDDSLTPEARMLHVMRWFVSSWHIRPKKTRRPFLPVPGEVFRATWSLEDYSLSPISRPIVEEHESSFGPDEAFPSSQQSIAHSNECFYEAEVVDNTSLLHFSISNSIRFHAELQTKVNWWGNNVVYECHGKSCLYIITFPNRRLQGIIIGRVGVDVDGPCDIECVETGLLCKLNFRKQGWVGPRRTTIEGNIRKGNRSIYEVQGFLHGKLYVSNCLSGQRTMLFDANNCTVLRKHVNDIADQEENESRRIWKDLMSSLKKLDFSTAALNQSSILRTHRIKHPQTPSYFVPRDECIATKSSLNIPNNHFQMFKYIHTSFLED